MTFTFLAALVLEEPRDFHISQRKLAIQGQRRQKWRLSFGWNRGQPRSMLFLRYWTEKPFPVLNIQHSGVFHDVPVHFKEPFSRRRAEQIWNCSVDFILWCGTGKAGCHSSCRCISPDYDQSLTQLLLHLISPVGLWLMTSDALFVFNKGVPKRCFTNFFCVDNINCKHANKSSPTGKKQRI